MPKKRGNNEGTISKRKNGLWCAAITVGYNENGNQKRQFFYGKTRQEVAEKLNQSLSGLSQGTFVEANRIKFADWLDIWLKEYKRPSVRLTTFESYEYLTRVHIKPVLGHLCLKDIKPEHIQRLYNDKVNNGKIDGTGGISAKTVKNIHNVIHAALDQAVKNNIVVRNVSEVTTLPKHTNKEMRVLTIDEQYKFIRELDGERLRMAFLLALGTGVREGELLALHWYDVDLKQGSIRITQTVRRTRTFDSNAKTKTAIIYQEPKTKAGNRNIPLPESLVTELKEHRKSLLIEKIEAGPLYTDNDLVFCNEIGAPIETSSLIKRFHKLTKKAGLEGVNVHALRHTYATRLLEANEHPKTVQELLGHADISLTLNTYSHVMPELKSAAAQKLDFLFQNKKPSINEGL